MEKRQAVLGRLVEIGAELLAITAACSRAQALAKRGSAGSAGSAGSGAAGQEAISAVKLADLFSRHARRRVEEKFAAVFDNEDVATYAVAQQVLKDEHRWLESGIVRG